MTKLYCCGCGNLVGDFQEGKLLAISCGECNALAPILVRDLQSTLAILPESGAAIPLTAVRLFAGALQREGRDLPHWQYFLGFREDYTSPAREAALALLKLQGCTSALDCRDERCLRDVPRLVQRVKERAARRELRERVAEIGEE